MRIFLALTLNECGRADEAVGLLLGVIAKHGDVTDLGRYAGGLSGLAQWMVDGRPEDSTAAEIAAPTPPSGAS